MRRCLCVALLLLAPPVARAADAPVVGFLRVDADKYFAEEQKHDPFAKRVLAPNGFGFGLAEWREFWGERTEPSRTLDLLRQFNVVVVDTPFDRSIRELGGNQRRTAAVARRALEAYIAEGGGALVVLQAVRYPGDMDQDYANLVLEGLGVEMLHEGIFDPQSSFQASIASIFPPEGFFRTENVAGGHPVTEGVGRLCLPQYHNGKTPGVVTPKLSGDWQVLARGEESAQSYRVTREHVTDYTQVGTHDKAPPIVAARDFGRGRVVVFSVPARSVHTNYGVPGWNMVVETDGDVASGLQSDGARLVLNALRWLAEPSADNPNLGTFTTDPVPPVRFPESVEWDSREFPAPTPGIRGLIGAQTSLSNGTETVAEYVDAARAAGLSFIVFNEALEEMTEGELERLKAQCEAACTDDFYACPGLEFSDDMGNRWAIWGERVISPQAEFDRAYGETNAERPVLKQWDGKVMHNPGQYWEYCAYPPNMLLTYGNLRENGAHPANMWWFYRMPPYVYDGADLVEDQFAEWLAALRDVRHISPASYTRVTSPSRVGAAAQACATGGSSIAHVKDWLNTRCGNFLHPADPYVTGGPTVEQWAAINAQHDLPFEVRGKQRARLRFQVSSPDGIREVLVHNCDYGVVRRFLGNGETTFAQEFNVVHDRDHTLTLEVIDGRGRRAISDKRFLWSYKMSLQRCGDNLNFLNGVGLCWHPDRNEMLPLVQMYQGMPVESIGGYDSAARLARQSSLGTRAMAIVRTRELNQYPMHREHGVLRKILDVTLPGNDVKICDMEMGPLVEPFDTLARDTPARTSVPRVVDDNDLFTRDHRSYYLQNRTNMYVTWDHRRAREGALNYRGGMVWHVGKITFKRDCTLEGGLPIMLFYFTGGALDGPTTVLIDDAEEGSTTIEIPVGERLIREGAVAPGGFVTACPLDQHAVFYAGADTDFRYVLLSDPQTGRITQLQVGLGRDGETVAAGQEFSYRFGMATLGGPLLETHDYLTNVHDIADSFAIGGDGGVDVDVTTGEIVAKEMFLAIQAEQHEAALRVEPRQTIIDLPISVDGILENGCAAVYGTKHPWFRWVGVAEGKAWLQEDVDKGSDLWIGNVFAADDDRLKLTLVDQGQAEDGNPFLEVHNPTDAPVSATVTSPPHTPEYGGTRLDVQVPAGSTTVVTLAAD